MKKAMPEGKGKSFSFLYAALFLLFLGLFSGCGNKFFDPSQVGRFRPVPAVNVILDSLGVAEEAPVAWEGAEEPLPIDSVVTQSDYVFRSGDVVSVAIFELLQEGVQYVNNYVVTETGKISVPEVGVILAAGMTETQLEDRIRRILSPSILKEPSVTVTLVRSQQRAFSVIGDGVPLPGRYFLPRYDFRLTDALATAGGPRQFNVSYIYVSRYVGDKQQAPDEINPGFGELELKVIEPQTTSPVRQRRNNVTPRAQYQWPESNVVISSAEMVTEGEYSRTPSNFGQLNDAASRWLYAKDVGMSNGRPALQAPVAEPTSVEDILKTLSEHNGGENGVNGQAGDTFRSRREPASRQSRPSVAPSGPQGTGELLDQNGNIEWIFRDGKWIPVQVGTRKPAEVEPTGHIEWIFQNGKWVPVQVGTPKPTEPVIKMGPGEQLAAPPEEEAPVLGMEQEIAGTRLIRIPADKLLAGDPRYNIIIKSGDSIFVPVDIVGEFCIEGNVNRTGYIPLTGRPMTLKQAIAAAGGLGPLAWPKRCEVIRRIGRKKEEIVMVDLDKIASGEQPDFFIKPHDLINVGTHATARWRAILRNAFRATYGFGFVYDRNFADRDFGTRRPIPNWF
ncbi:MAG TPA: polysaccharide biosynthesis/export family protein [Sedimentisphaerales bacterium]|nr:polysaccharide biosynthesis/export family protein [Sedimentisphaerales bacterium]